MASINRPIENFNDSSICKKLNIGYRKYQEGNLEEAERVFQEILEIRSKEPQCLHLLGCIYKDRGLFEKAIELISTSIEINPSNHIPYFNLGNTFFLAGDLDNAIKILKECISISPNFAEAWYSLGQAYNFHKDNLSKESVECYKNALKIKEDHIPSLANLALILYKSNNTIEAELLLNKVTILQPENEYYILIYIKTLIKNKKISCAKKYLEKTLKSKPNSTNILKCYGDLLNNVGEYSEALKVFSKISRNSTSQKSLRIRNLGDYKDPFNLDSRVGKYGEFESKIKALTTSKIQNTRVFKEVRSIVKDIYPVPFEKDLEKISREKRLNKQGFMLENKLCSEKECETLINHYNSSKSSINDDFKAVIMRTNIFKNAISSIFYHSGIRHIIWHSKILKKTPLEINPSDKWHYDIHYNYWTPKILIYLNSQTIEESSTDICDKDISYLLSNSTGYLGLVNQRSKYLDYIKNLKDKSMLNEKTFDPPFTRVTPKGAGEALLFYPSQVLHRGVNPKQGSRYIVALSLTPLPPDLFWNTEDCVNKSIDILEGMVSGLDFYKECDYIPYWEHA